MDSLLRNSVSNRTVNWQDTKIPNNEKNGISIIFQEFIDVLIIFFFKVQDVSKPYFLISELTSFTFTILLFTKGNNVVGYVISCML